MFITLLNFLCLELFWTLKSYELVSLRSTYCPVVCNREMIAKSLVWKQLVESKFYLIVEFEDVVAVLDCTT